MLRWHMRAAKGIALIVGGLVLIGALSTLRRASWLPAIAYVALFAAYKVIYLKVGYFEWYGVPAVAVLVLVAAVGLDRLCNWLSAATRARFTPAQVAVLPTLLLALAYIAPLPYRTVAERRIQGFEDKVRDPLGRYLGEVTNPGQTIGSESSGYVGCYTTPPSTTIQASSRRPWSVHSRRPKRAGTRCSQWWASLPCSIRTGWFCGPSRPSYWRGGIRPPRVNTRRCAASATPGDQETVSVRGFDVREFDGDFIVFRRNP
jgi:hypothetical protein